jgi:hypothetical protein
MLRPVPLATRRAGLATAWGYHAPPPPPPPPSPPPPLKLPPPPPLHEPDEEGEEGGLKALEKSFSRLDNKISSGPLMDPS